MTKPMPKIITQARIFKGLSDEERLEIARFLEIRKYKEGEVVFAENDPGKRLFIVGSGMLNLVISGQEQQQFHAGDLFGELAVINESIRTGTVKALKPSVLYCLKSDDLLNPQHISPLTAIKIYVCLAKKVTSYLKQAGNTATSQLLCDGEGEHLEFKSTLRINMHTGKKDARMEHAVLKTIAAFLNSEGGVLLIGVNDDGEVLGLDTDGFPNDDKALLHLSMLVNDKIGQHHMRNIDCVAEVLKGKKLIRVDVRAASTPAYLRDNGEESFYIRTGPSTSSLRVSEVYDFIRTRFSPQIS